MNIQRYETVGYASDTVKHDTGKYVKWKDVEKLLAMLDALQAEVRASRNAISVSVGKFQLMTVCGGNAIDDLNKARAETDQQGALT